MMFTDSYGKVSEKYLAGFLDADGSIGLDLQPTGRTYLRLTFSQKQSQDAVIHMIQRDYGGATIDRQVGDGKYTDLVISGKQAAMILERIRNHLVVKREYAQWCLDRMGLHVDPAEFRAARQAARRAERVIAPPNYPSRKWMAGYFDGDGCLSLTVYKPSGNATIVATIAAAAYDVRGIELIFKAFGGGIYDMCDGRVKQWRVAPDAAKVKQMLGHFAMHSIVKRDQAELLLKCAAMGHFRDGNNIKAAMKHLKSHPHRLSDPAPDLSVLMRTIRDLPAHKRSDYGQFQRNERGHYTSKAMLQSAPQ